MSLEFEFHLQFPCDSLSSELSDFCQSAQCGNEHKCKQTLKNTCPRVMKSILIMSSPPISILHRPFCWRYSNSRDVLNENEAIGIQPYWPPACLLYLRHSLVYHLLNHLFLIIVIVFSLQWHHWCCLEWWELDSWKQANLCQQDWWLG